MISTDPLEAFYARVATNPTMKSLMTQKDSGDASWHPQFPDSILEADQYPRGTYFMVSGSELGTTADEVLIQTDNWVWPTGVTGGVARLNAIDAQLIALLDRTEAKGAPGLQWAHGGSRVFSRSVSWRDFPTAPGEPLRRRRDFRLRVSG